MRVKIKTFSIVVVFAILLLTGLLSYQDYGLSNDEEACHYRAVVTANYVAETVGLKVTFPDSIPAMADYSDRDHGVLFDLAAYTMERLLGLDDSRQIFIFKHLLTYLVFFAGLIAFYQLVTRRLKDWRWGLLGTVMLFLSPRLFADAFYNAKDLVFMVTYLIAMNTASALFEKPTLGRTLVHGLATAVAIATRVMGIVLIPATIFFLLLPQKRIYIAPEPWARRLGRIAAYLAASLALTILFWPMLWSNPLENFVIAFQSLSRFERWSKEVLLMGRYYLSTDLPWYFSLAWITLTTPLLYLGLFLVGLIEWLRRVLVQHKLRFWQQSDALMNTFFQALFWGPLVSVVIFNSVLYDGWRQLYFIYPAFLIIALTGLYTLSQLLKGKRRIWTYLLTAIVMISLGSTAVWMVKAHPLQNVYFNSLASSNWRSQYDLDYWGLSNRAALEAIVTAEPSGQILIAEISAASVSESFRILEPQDRARMSLIPFEAIASTAAAAPHQPVYVFNNYKRQKDPDILDRNPAYVRFYEKKIAGETILTVYQWVGPNNEVK
ncbi:MAG: hypothetical protein PHQ83_11015 [Eubacteriales bacterium]|nr:hypothetical protein [Eubacteriales bacterium]